MFCGIYSLVFGFFDIIVFNLSDLIYFNFKFSIFSLLIYKKTIDFCILTLYPVILL